MYMSGRALDEDLTDFKHSLRDDVESVYYILLFKFSCFMGRSVYSDGRTELPDKQLAEVRSTLKSIFEDGGFIQKKLMASSRPQYVHGIMRKLWLREDVQEFFVKAFKFVQDAVKKGEYDSGATDDCCVHLLSQIREHAPKFRTDRRTTVIANQLGTGFSNMQRNLSSTSIVFLPQTIKSDNADSVSGEKKLTLGSMREEDEVDPVAQEELSSAGNAIMSRG